MLCGYVASTVICLASSQPEKGADSSEHDVNVSYPVDNADPCDKPSKIVSEKELGKPYSFSQ